MFQRIGVALIVALAATVLSVSPAAAQLPPQDIGRSGAGVHALEVTLGDELRVSHSMRLDGYLMYNWGFGVEIPPQFEFVSVTPSDGCSVQAEWVSCFGADPDDYAPGPIEIVLRAIEVGEDIPIVTGAQFAIGPGHSGPNFYGTTTEHVDVTLDELYRTLLSQQECQIMEAIAPGGEVDSDLLLAAAEFLTRGAEFGFAIDLGPIADPSPVWCGRTVRVSPDAYDRFAWGAAQWNVAPEDYAQAAAQMIAAILAAIVGASG